MEEFKIMGIFDLFKRKSDGEKLRLKIRTGFDECVKDVLKEHRDVLNDPLFGGLMVEAAIASFYQSIKEDSVLWLIADQIGIDYDQIVDEERDRAIRKYLK